MHQPRLLVLNDSSSMGSTLYFFASSLRMISFWARTEFKVQWQMSCHHMINISYYQWNPKPTQVIREYVINFNVTRISSHVFRTFDFVGNLMKTPSFAKYLLLEVRWEMPQIKPFSLGTSTWDTKCTVDLFYWTLGHHGKSCANAHNAHKCH